MRPPVAGVENEDVGLLPPAGRLVRAVNLQDRVRVPLPVQPHPFPRQEMRPHEFHRAVVILQELIHCSTFDQWSSLAHLVDLMIARAMDFDLPGT